VECPKCGHRRSPRASAPEWQCPACGIAYAKYDAYLKNQQILSQRRALQKRPAETDVLRDWAHDRSLWGLVAANAFTLITALGAGWTLKSILLVYWGQSVVIGLAFVVRILSLDRFSTKGLKVNDRRPPETAATKRSMAMFFLMHYGFFHAIYLVFLFAFAMEDGVPLGFDLPYLLAIAAFAVNHAYSLRYNIDIDRRGCPNIGSLMFIPYMRVFPMHFIIIIGGNLNFAAVTLPLFVLFKTVADVGSHLLEHHLLSSSGAEKPADTA
jgi:hypothetical protein